MGSYLLYNVIHLNAMRRLKGPPTQYFSKGQSIFIQTCLSPPVSNSLCYTFLILNKVKNIYFSNWPVLICVCAVLSIMAPDLYQHLLYRIDLLLVVYSECYGFYKTLYGMFWKKQKITI